MLPWPEGRTRENTYSDFQQNWDCVNRDVLLVPTAAVKTEPDTSDSGQAHRMEPFSLMLKEQKLQHNQNSRGCLIFF